MKGKKQFLPILLVLAFVIALPASGVWGAQDQEPQAPENPYIWYENVEIQKDTPTYYFRDTASGANDWWLRAYHGSTPDWFEIYDWSNNRRPFAIEAGSQNDTIFIEADGDVGFRTQSPGYSLDIVNSSPDLRLFNTATSNYIFHINPQGRVAANATYDALLGYSNATAGNYWGVYGRSSSPDGEGVYALNIATTGVAHGLYASSSSSSGRAVEAVATSTTGSTHGVYATTPSTSGRAVAGYATATTGGAYGVVGSSSSTTGGVGVLGGGGVFGVWGIAGTSTGTGVVGLHADSSGEGYGVQGVSYSSQGTGVYGGTTHASATTYGVYGKSSSTQGRGVYGEASATTGINFGVAGVTNSTTGRGVLGYAASSTGANFGLSGRSDSSGGIGLSGYNAATTGSGAVGLYGGVRSPNGWAGKFITAWGNGVYISAPAGKVGLTVASGTKNAVVPTADGNRLLYTEESTEVWFTDYGFGQLQKGVAVVQIDPVFAQTVNLQQSYHVFLEEYGPVELYVSQRTPGWFEVRAVKGKPDVEFSYRLVAKRLGHEARRLESAPWADDDPNLYPEMQANWEAMFALPEDMLGPLPDVQPPELPAVDLSPAPAVEPDSEKPVGEEAIPPGEGP